MLKQVQGADFCLNGEVDRVDVAGVSPAPLAVVGLGCVVDIMDKNVDPGHELDGPVLITGV
ncbi:MAG: hypothetical protein CMO26_15725 [Thiotrichales bacterium]|nr:hypothetical protein [Thiotrichales bacterium]